jgi:hypothetical protein
MTIHEEMDNIKQQAGELAEQVQKIHEPVFRSDYSESDFVEEELYNNYMRDERMESDIRELAANEYRAEQKIALDKLNYGEVF